MNQSPCGCSHAVRAQGACPHGSGSWGHQAERSAEPDTFEVAECPFGCGELHEVTRVSLGSYPILSCRMAPPGNPIALSGFGGLQTRTVRRAGR